MRASGGPTERRHRISEYEFDLLAAGLGGRDVISRLWSGQRSRRMLLLRVLWDAVSKRPDYVGPLPRYETAWQLLVDTERLAPDSADSVLLHPHTGTWVGHALRRIRRVASDPAPLWGTLGYLHTLAAAGAMRAGLEFGIRVPAYDGVVVLPTLGFGWLPGQMGWHTAEVEGDASGIRIHSDGGTVEVPKPLGTDGPGWFGLRQLQADTDGHQYTLILDDLDPYREAGRAKPPRRLGDPEFEQWRERFEAAWVLLVRHHYDRAAMLPAGLTTLVPRSAVHRFRTFSGSAEESFGSTTISLPPDPETLAVTLLHEFQHTKLGALLHLLPMYEDSGEELLYAPWRPDPRRAPSLLQGVYAFLGVTAFWRVQRHVNGDMASDAAARLAHFEFAHWREQTWRTWQVLRARPGLTELGHRFVAGMGATMEPWQAEEVPAAVGLAAAAVARDHRATWRIQHTRPAASDVARMADAFLGGRSRPALSGRVSVVESGTFVPRDARIMLARLRIADRPAFHRWLEHPPVQELADLVPGDVEYLTGNQEAALRAYSEQIQTDPNRFGAWVGLGLALAASGQHAAASALLERPDLVLAVYQEVLLRDKGSPPDPVVLAAWLGR